MLKIKKVDKYNIPKYPQEVYKVYPDFISLSTPRNVLAIAVMTLILDACSDTNLRPTAGIPDTEIVTESNARSIIDKVFNQNGIELTHDMDVKLEITPNDSAVVNVDGFNDSLQVGYEYMIEEDYTSIDSKVRTALDSLLNESEGPFIKTIDATEYEFGLESLTQEFIDALKANGVI